MEVIFMPRKAPERPKAKTPDNVVPLPDIKKASTKHVPTSISRNAVMLGCLNGMTQEQIAGLIEIDPKTLRAHYADELANGRAKMMAKVTANLFSIATQTRDLKAALTACIFMLKTKGGWKEGGDPVEKDETQRRVVVSLNIGDKEPRTA